MYGKWRGLLKKESSKNRVCTQEALIQSAAHEAARGDGLMLPTTPPPVLA